ncbi:hypothetical protein [Sporohalobacter salinus]|uniref:hypothetical protein n=1 Tax=Sporohalobacter salinus TaxID=1494606 RepID=UPI00195F7797|nr:hypothetical protein [Sporohalobacter salinus]MBM7624825.1 hypothetical protein [Sporohalobacter salinus]
MKKVLTLLIVIVVVLVGCNQDLKANEEELLNFLEELKGVEYNVSKFRMYFDRYSKREEKFTEQFYKDFINGDVEFITPEYETNNLNESKFRKYTKKYSGLVFKIGRVLNNETIVDIKEAHYNFKVYQINFDDNETNGKEEVFYSSGYWNEKGIDNDGIYEVLNDSSEQKAPYYDYKGWLGEQVVEAEYVEKEKERTKDYNGLIKYKGRYYIYEILNWDTRIMISFYSWNKELNQVTCMVNYKLSLKGENKKSKSDEDEFVMDTESLYENMKERE